ncbi:MAG: DEAD/DEAH box helicase [Candidatus Omnitrophica bacterium]|nr:DEAD/DEAH box helicase [Candidatus Omnitrophota bacterium]MBU2250633.1 DEAD/DEAH box helicase [Candidatus Omnitrophota bacterium]MBU2473193.1 DEAD/DEAH box helicase [Candidatus Omnitrophota bacterium]
MFDIFKIYTQKQISIQEANEKLIGLGYRRFDQIAQEGDFSVRGDTLEIFPANFNYPLRIEWEFDSVKKIFSFDKEINRKILDYDFLILVPCHRRSRRYTSEDIPLSAVLEIKKGDYIVHSRYGIGKFLGVKKLKVRDQEDYYFEIEYEHQDKLYVSKEEVHLIQKYANFNLARPRLSRLGTKEWQRTKEKVEKGIKAFALAILRIEAQRKVIGGLRYAEDDSWQKKFEQDFPYQETPDQAKATQDVKNDMQNPGCMDRIICGDVGYGKTEVAMRAAFKAVSSGKQVVILVPTTILAYQHYVNLTKRLKDFPFSVEMISRFRSPREQKNILKRLTEGKVDIIIGTHRILSQDVAFKDLGLLIIDEEHKFGVTHKEKIKKLRVNVDVLSLTATPIPRTLYMSLIGIKNISLIKTPPKERLAIKTEVMLFDIKRLGDMITREITRGGQVFFVHNRIESIGRIEQSLKKVLPKQARIEVVHGRMASRQMEEVMLKFIDKKLDCLLSTAIVESGIDIPTANTIIINNAHRFGLADLHQLRGRVGRHNLQAYCYLVAPPKESLSSDASGRLKMIEEFSHLGAGFEVAMSDLELRGAGNILGREQHGFIWMVGFDLYCRLLKKEIEYLKEAFKLNVN